MCNLRVYQPDIIHHQQKHLKAITHMRYTCILQGNSSQTFETIITFSHGVLILMIRYFCRYSKFLLYITKPLGADSIPLVRFLSHMWPYMLRVHAINLLSAARISHKLLTSVSILDTFICSSLNTVTDCMGPSLENFC